MSDNFYVVLGVSREADLNEIRRAYRNLVRQLHPDAAPQEDLGRFHEVQQAYEILSDPDTRRAHDATLEGQAVPVSKGAAELRRQPPTSWRGRGPGSLWTTGHDRPFHAIDELFGGFVPGIFTRGRQANRQKDLYVEMILSPEEAKSGGLIPLQVPVQRICPVCHGTGIRDFMPCNHCREGLLDFHEVELTVSPNVSHGQRARLSLEDLGLPEVFLNVLVTIQP